MKTSNIQHPTSREAPNSKLQWNFCGALELDAWNFSGAWSLEFGAFPIA
jgi:hypothetical protein